MTVLANICRFADDILAYQIPNAKPCNGAHFALLAIVRERKLDRREVGMLRFNVASALLNLCLAHRDTPAAERPALINAIRQTRELIAKL